MSIDLRVLRCKRLKDVAYHLNALTQEHSDEDITTALMEHVKTGALPPTVFKPWLGINQSVLSLSSALSQETSLTVTRLAIKQLRRQLLTKEWHTTWTGLGGVPSLLKLFAHLPVLLVQYMCDAIVRSVSSADGIEKRGLVTELYQSLLRTDDQRQLRHIFQRLIPACTDDIVIGALCGSSLAAGRMIKLTLKLRPEICQKLAYRYVSEKLERGRDALLMLFSGRQSRATEPSFQPALVAFSVDILVHLNDHSNSLSPMEVLSDIITPIARRTLKRCTSREVQHRIITLILAYISKSPSIQDRLNNGKHSLIRKVIECWLAQPDLFEEPLEKLLKCDSKRVRKAQSSDLTRLLRSVPRVRRLQLLQICYLQWYGFDFEDEDNLKTKQISIPSEALLALPSDEAYQLYTKLRAARGKACFVERAISGSSVLHAAKSDDSESSFCDTDLCHVVFLHVDGRYEDAKVIADAQIAQHKRTATKSPTPEVRAEYACSVFRFAIASGSLKICQDFVDWSGRFSKDSWVMHELYRYYVDDFVLLLSGIPRSLARMSTDVIKDRVQRANSLLMATLGIMFSSLREPSFSVVHWRSTLGLPFLVVQERIRRTATLRESVVPDETDLFDVLWRDTVKILIDLEKKYLASGHEKLDMRNLCGPLYQQGMETVDMMDTQPSTLRFLDELARARDDLWRQYRPTLHSIVASLPKVFPRGLPVQVLVLPFVLNITDLTSQAPYIASRVETALFLAPEAALEDWPNDKETCEAIGPFVDSYPVALSIFLCSSLKAEENRRRAKRAWSHAVGEFSGTRMSTDEAERYWQFDKASRRNLSKHWPDAVYLDKKMPDWPLLPNLGSRDETIEWDPNALRQNYPSRPSRRIDHLTYIDVSKSLSVHHGSYSHLTRFGQITPPKPYIPGSTNYDIWSTERFWYAQNQAAVQEAQILSALLFLDSLNSTQNRLLAKKFPDSNIVTRYPATYLDEIFLSERNLDTDRALSLLNSQMTSVPPDLLYQLAMNALSTLNSTSADSTKISKVERVAFNLIKLLTSCDRPELASDVVIQAIITRPDASSWHRRLLSRTYLKRLHSMAASAFILAFTKTVIDKLNEQSTVKDTAENAQSLKEDQKANKSLIKVTTIKLLAELLADANFVPKALVLDILSKLMTRATHIDIRRAVFTSLLELYNAAPSAMIESVIVALEFVIPIAGSLREGNMMSETDWDHAEKTLQFPEVDAKERLFTDSPMLENLINIYPSLRCHTSDPRKSHLYLERIILPAIHQLENQTARWVDIFLRKYGTHEGGTTRLEIPTLPWTSHIYQVMIQTCGRATPRSLIRNFAAYLSFTIAPPLTVETFNQRLKDDDVLKDDPNVKMWLKRFARDPMITACSASALLSMLPDTDNESGDVELQDIQDTYMTIYKQLLQHESEELVNVSTLVDRLSYRSHRSIDEGWGSVEKPLVEEIIHHVEGLRTQEWQRSSERSPPSLPDTFQYKLWILEYSAQVSARSHLNNGKDEAHYAEIARQVGEVIEVMPVLYHRHLALLERSMAYMSSEHKLAVAFHLGNAVDIKSDNLNLQAYLKFEVAAGLLAASSKDIADSVFELRVRKMVSTWQRCQHEDVRRMVIEKSLHQLGDG